jgi:hypothetical protein
MTDDEFLDGAIPSEETPTDLDQLDVVSALQARVLALEALVELLLERDIQKFDSAEEYANSEASRIFSRMMVSTGFPSASEEVAETAEAIATSIIERIARDQIRKTAN